MSNANEQVTPWVPNRTHEPLFVNGRTTKATYLCVAVKDGDASLNCIGIKSFGSGIKVHYWPSAAYFGVKAMEGYEGLGAGKSRGIYEGDMVPIHKLDEWLTALALVPTNTVAATNKVMELLGITTGDVEASIAYNEPAAPEDDDDDDEMIYPAAPDSD
jgi:hypothetical protein